MMKRKVLNLLLTMSLSANAMVVVTWIITNELGYELISPTYLFRNMVSIVGITGISTLFGWFYSRNTNSLIMGSFHLLITLVTFVLCGMWAHWFPLDLMIILTSVLIFIFIFIVIWLFHYFHWKNQIKKINEKLG